MRMLTLRISEEDYRKIFKAMIENEMEHVSDVVRDALELYFSYMKVED